MAMTNDELIQWRKETLEMAKPIMERLDRACPYYTVVVTPRGATLVIDEHHTYNPKYDPQSKQIQNTWADSASNIKWAKQGNSASLSDDG